jgi:hypothetical protein
MKRISVALGLVGALTWACFGFSAVAQTAGPYTHYF